MVREMEILMFIGALGALNVLALLYGADSREGVDRDPGKLGLPR